MGSKVLITGAAGYIGGSIVANLLSSNSSLLKKLNINVAVRSKEQAEALSKLDINVLQLDLRDEAAVFKSILEHKIDIVIHTASSIDPIPALNLINALGRVREVTGEEVYYIHTSGISALFESTGWTHGLVKDTDSVFDLEKELADSFPIRKTDVTVIEQAKEKSVTSFIVMVPLVYGRGSGEWNKLSVNLPACVRAGIQHKTMYKFAENKRITAVRIEDLATFYSLIIEKILGKDTIPNGGQGYYFPIAHEFSWWDALEKIAQALKTRSLAHSPVVQIWPSDEFAGEALKFPPQFVPILWNSSAKAIAENRHKLGWNPLWDEERFLQSMDDEAQDVIELGEAKSSLGDSVAKITASA